MSVSSKMSGQDQIKTQPLISICLQKLNYKFLVNLIHVRNMLRNFKTTTIVSQRTFKNFGHKRQPIPAVTTLWHGFLTFTFIGLGIEWKRIKTFFFGADGEDVFIKKDKSVEEEPN